MSTRLSPPSSSRSGEASDGSGWGHAHSQPRPPAQRVVEQRRRFAVRLDALKRARERSQQRLAFEARQQLSDAHMDASAEGALGLHAAGNLNQRLLAHLFVAQQAFDDLIVDLAIHRDSQPRVLQSLARSSTEPSKPSRLAHVLIIDAVQPCGHYSWPA